MIGLVSAEDMMSNELERSARNASEHRRTACRQCYSSSRSDVWGASGRRRGWKIPEKNGMCCTETLRWWWWPAGGEWNKCFCCISVDWISVWLKEIDCGMELRVLFGWMINWTHRTTLHHTVYALMVLLRFSQYGFTIRSIFLPFQER